MPKSIHSKPHNALIERLIKARKAAGLTQRELAERLGKPQSFVAKYEGGERRLDLIELLKITAALGADTHTIIRAVAKTL